MDISRTLARVVTVAAIALAVAACGVGRLHPSGAEGAAGAVPTPSPAAPASADPVASPSPVASPIASPSGAPDASPPAVPLPTGSPSIAPTPSVAPSPDLTSIEHLLDDISADLKADAAAPADEGSTK